MEFLGRLCKCYPDDAKYVIILFRVYLQMGLLGKAEEILSLLRMDVQADASALLALVKENHSFAVEKYTSLLESHSAGSLIFPSNLALSHLNNANGQSAIAVLEPALREPRDNVGVLPYAAYNLCTMYEVRDDKARARKESIMENIVGRYGDVCGKGHFKLDSLR